MPTLFVLGLDEQNRELLEDLPAADLSFHGLLDTEHLIGAKAEDLDIAALLTRARDELASADESPDAIIGFWDFPVSSMVPMLCESLGLPSAPLTAVVRCEHKYWNRLEQAMVTDDLPSFGIASMERRGEHDELPEGMGFPVWVKPVKSASSEMAFHVADQDELDAAMDEIRDGIDRMGEPFQYVMDRLDLPEEIADLVGYTSRLDVVKDLGVVRFEGSGLELRRRADETYSSVAGDFESLSGETDWTMGFRRDDWDARTHTFTRLTATQDSFEVHAELDAYDGDRRVCSLNWDRTIPRDQV